MISTVVKVVPVLGVVRDLLETHKWRPVGSGQKSPGALSLVEAVCLGFRIYSEKLEAALTFNDVWHRPIEEQSSHLLGSVCQELGITIAQTCNLSPRNGSCLNLIEHFSAMPGTTQERVIAIVEDTIQRILVPSAPAPA